MDSWGAEDPKRTPQCLHFNKNKTKNHPLHSERWCWPGVCLLGAGAFEETTPVTARIKVIQSRDLGSRHWLAPTSEPQSYFQIFVFHAS